MNVFTTGFLLLLTLGQLGVALMFTIDAFQLVPGISLRCAGAPDAETMLLLPQGISQS
ncbi:hypothetical protein DFH09DRAFT_1362598 [Mycena vulgaris]|nr:hypothetical protein DFH09DRAFT_1362598 [Mycena vulgaris]